MEISPLLITKANTLSEHSKGGDEVIKFQSFKNTPVGWFTMDGKGNFKGEDQSLVKYLHLPENLERVYMNLAKTHPEDDYNIASVMELAENLDVTLQWVMENNSDSKGHPKIPDADFISQRNLFAKILKLPYLDRDVLDICAIKLHDTIYLCDFQTETQERDCFSLSTNKFLFDASKQGIKFQHFMLTDTHGEAPDPNNEPFIRDLQQLRIMLKASVGNHTLLMSSKVKGIHTPDDLLELSSATFFDVRTNKNRDYSRDKLIHWWSDGILSNLSKIYVGLREENGMVKSIDALDVSNMLIRAKSAPTFTGKRGRGGRGGGNRGHGRYYPSPAASPRSDSEMNTSDVTMYNLCFQALDDFLTYVKKTVGKDENTPYHFKWSSKGASYMYAEKLDKADEKYKFIPDWYTQWLTSCQAATENKQKA